MKENYSQTITPEGVIILPPALARRWKKKTVRILPLAGGFVVRPEKEFDWKEIEIKFRRVGKKISNSLLSEAISAAKKTIYADSR